MKDLSKIKELCPSAYDFIVNKADGAAVGKYELYPQDVHMPGVCVNERSLVRKIVVKVPVL